MIHDKLLKNNPQFYLHFKTYSFLAGPGAATTDGLLAVRLVPMRGKPLSPSLVPSELRKERRGEGIGTGVGGEVEGWRGSASFFTVQ